MPIHPQQVYAIDVGGTHLRAARVDRTGRILAREGISTPEGGHPDAVIPAIVTLVRSLGGTDIWPAPVGVGVAAPGPLDPTTGVVYATPNMVGWDHVPLADRLVAAFGQPVWLHNDANLAALGEARHGAGQGYDPLVYLTVSTGVGGGIVLANRIYAGAHGLAGELGHMIIRAGGPACNFGHAGCLEALVSGTSIARQALQQIEAGEPSSLAALVRSGQTPTAVHVAEAAEADDPLAQAVFHDVGDALGLAIGSFINAFDPARVILGGGVSRSWTLFETAMWAAVHRVAMAWAERPIEILPAQLGDDAGLIGAAAYAWDKLAEDA